MGQVKIWLINITQTGVTASKGPKWAPRWPVANTLTGVRKENLRAFKLQDLRRQNPHTGLLLMASIL